MNHNVWSGEEASLDVVSCLNLKGNYAVIINIIVKDEREVTLC